MKTTTGQGHLFPDTPRRDDDFAINARCRVRTCGGYRVVSVSGIVLAHYAVGDRMGEAYATQTRFPGTSLQLRFEVKPAPKRSSAFPGPRMAQPRQKGGKPDIRAGGRSGGLDSDGPVQKRRMKRK